MSTIARYLARFPVMTLGQCPEGCVITHGHVIDIESYLAMREDLANESARMQEDF